MSASRQAVLAACGVAALVVIGAACSKQKSSESSQLGDAAPPEVERVTIEALQKDKARYAGRTVVVEGRAAGVGCVDCGGILITDKTWRLLVEPADKGQFRIEPRKGALVRAWGVLKVEKKAEKGAGSEEKHPEGEKEDPAHERLHEELGNIELKAKGVQWL